MPEAQCSHWRCMALGSLPPGLGTRRTQCTQCTLSRARASLMARALAGSERDPLAVGATLGACARASRWEEAFLLRSRSEIVRSNEQQLANVPEVLPGAQTLFPVHLPSALAFALNAGSHLRHCARTGDSCNLQSSVPSHLCCISTWHMVKQHEW